MSSRCIFPRIFPILIAACVLGSTLPAAAAPVPFTGDLPLDSKILATLRADLSSDEFAATLDYLGSLRVFEDDTAQTTVYLAPAFDADSTQEVIGGQEIATDLLDLLDAFDALLVEINGSYFDYARLQSIVTDQLALADRLAQMTDGVSQSQRQTLINAARNSAELTDVNALLAQMTAAMNQLPATLRRAIATALLSALSTLGVPITNDDRVLVVSNPVQFALGVLARVRAQLATMLLGVRHASFVSGITARDAKLLEHYLVAAPAVQVQPLPIQALRVVSLASLPDPGLPSSGASAPAMIRGVNATTGGVCGLTTQCTVIIEYTEIGARSALLSTRGASIMPVQFIGDVAASGSELITPTSCDIAALRQHLILPFGMDLLSDREIQRVMLTPGICHTPSGAAANRPAAAITLGTLYRDLLYDSGLLSVAHRHSLPSQIAGLLASVPGATAALGAIGSILPQIDLASFLDAFSRRMFIQLMPRLPDQLLAALIVARSAAAPPTTRFDFDGIAITCWKQGASGTYLAACPASAPDADTQDAIARTLTDRFCPQGSQASDCAAAIQAAPPDAQGFLWTDG